MPNPHNLFDSETTSTASSNSLVEDAYSVETEEDVNERLGRMLQETRIHRLLNNPFDSNPGEVEKILKAARRKRMMMLAEEYYAHLQSTSDISKYLEMPFGQVIKTVYGLRELKKSTMFWITVNPREGTPAKDFLALFERYVKRKYIENYRYCIETRTDDGSCGGVHGHLLIETKSPHCRSTVSQHLVQTFGDCVGDPQRHIVIKAMYNEDYVERVKSYVGKTKHADDALIRRELGIADIVTNIQPGSETHAPA